VPTIHLLTHERELHKKNNTGQLVLTDPNIDSRRIVWQRTSPDAELMHLIEASKIALLYPVAEDQESAPLNVYEHFLLLDCTWQESRKIVNKSPYLAGLPRIAVGAGKTSAYIRRRNQVAGGLCTAECVIELLNLKGKLLEAESLTQRFQDFNTQTP
jgi:DTW domain-containing protein YfiP